MSINWKPNTSQTGRCLALALLVLAALFSTGGCRSANAPVTPPPGGYAADNQIEVYGRHTCPICQRFMANLEAQELDYQFHDLDASEERAREMWSLVEQHHPQVRSVGLPVVHVNGTLLIQPGFAEFTNYLKAAR